MYVLLRTCFKAEPTLGEKEENPVCKRVLKWRNFQSASLTIADLEREARRAAQKDSAEGLIVLKKEDLNSILAAKPTVLIGRELVRDEDTVVVS